MLHLTEGYVLFLGTPEEPNLYSYVTGLEDLQLAGRLRGIPEDRVNRKSNELLDLLALSDAMADLEVSLEGRTDYAALLFAIATVALVLFWRRNPAPDA